jgi:hypothetical protein
MAHEGNLEFHYTQHKQDKTRKDMCMKNSRYWLGGFALTAVLILGTTVHDTQAEGRKSPLRGAWSFSQFVPATAALGTPTPIPTAAAGTFLMDDNNHFTGHAVLDTPLPIPNPTFEFDFEGSCTFRQGNAKNGMDCKLDAPAFGLFNVGRFCVVMGGRGGCFDEFRCIDTNEPESVVLVEFKRQNADTCR